MDKYEVINSTSEYSTSEWHRIDMKKLLEMESAYRWAIDKAMLGIEDPLPKVSTRILDLE